MPGAFHEILFPTDIALGSHGGPERRTEIVVLGSGAEERNSRWAASRRRYNAGYGVTTLDALNRIVAFFEERRGRLYGFRWQDIIDHKSCAPQTEPTPVDQEIGIGDGLLRTFNLCKTYGRDFAPWRRSIVKPVAGTVRVAVDRTECPPADWIVDATTGVITFFPGKIPATGTRITAGFEFHVPVRFDTDAIEVNLHGFRSGAIPTIPIVEIRP